MAQDDNNTTLEQVKDQIKNFCVARGWDPYHGPKDLAIGLVTESAELLELFRFVSENELVRRIEEPGLRQNIADELADSLYFILRFAQLYDFDLVTCVREKLIKNAIKYPLPEG